MEATWEVLVGCIMAWGLMKTRGVKRKIVTTWLYIEVALMFGSGILGLGQHYFWIGTQWSASHGHLAFFGAYATIVVAFVYLALQRWRGNVWMSGGLRDRGWKWKWALALLNVGALAMTVALLIAGYEEQSFVERASRGSTWEAYFAGQTTPWFLQAMQWRMAFGVMMTVGLLLLLWDFLTIGRGETRAAKAVPSPEDGE